MRRALLGSLAPVCPACRARSADHPLLITVETRGTATDLVEGVLQCPAPECQQEYPVVDGLPILVPDVRAFLASRGPELRARDDLSPASENLLVEAAGPGSAQDATLTQLSSYGWDHFGEWDPELVPATAGRQPGAVARTLTRGLELCRGAGLGFGEGPVLDLGAGPGRSTLDLAKRFGGATVGVDLGIPFLRLAARAARTGTVRYPVKRGGVRYDWRVYPIPIGPTDLADFWVADGVRLPFAAGTFRSVVSLNLLDCVYSPLDLLRETARVLQPGGVAIIASPYDWTGSATPIEAWIGGHSERGIEGGDSRAILRRLLQPGGHPASIDGLAIAAEDDAVPWQVRLHDRSTVEYLLDLVVLTRT